MEEGQVYSQFKRLRNISDSREFMQKLINSLDKNEISVEKARALGYLIKIFNDTAQLENLEARIETLESIINKKSA